MREAKERIVEIKARWWPNGVLTDEYSPGIIDYAPQDIDYLLKREASLPTEEEIAKIYYEIQSKTCRDCTWQTTGEKVIHAIAVRIGTAKE